MELNLCPRCSGWLRVTKKECRKCGLKLEADFQENPLVSLAREEQDFLLDFVICRGNFKALSQKLGLTYPTVRSYLDRIIAKMESLSHSITADEVLDGIGQGRINPEEGIKKLRKLKEGRNS
jgi:hypothetical protein